MTALAGLEMVMLAELELVDCRTALQFSLLAVLEIPNVAWVLACFEGFGPFKENKQSKKFFSSLLKFSCQEFSRDVSLPSDECATCLKLKSAITASWGGSNTTKNSNISMPM